MHAVWVPQVPKVENLYHVLAAASCTICQMHVFVLIVCIFAAGGEACVVGLLVTDGQLLGSEGGCQVPGWWTDVICSVIVCIVR